MSEATRSISLQEAVKVALAAQTFDKVLTLAESYHKYITSDATPAPSQSANLPAATKPAATKPAATKPAATKPAATKPAAKSEEQLAQEAADAAAATDPDDVTEEMIGADIQAFLQANKRDEITALLKQYGAKSKSTLSPEHYADFHAEAAVLLGGGDELTG